MRTGRLVAVAVLSLSLALTACADRPAPEPVAAEQDAAPAREDAPATPEAQDAAGTRAPQAAGVTGPAATDGLQDKDGNPIAIVPFEIESVPPSGVAMGELPFFSLPAGYAPVNRPTQRAFARFPFRIGEGLHWVEGASWNSLLGVDRDSRRDKEFSERELRRNLEAVFEQAGAKKVFEGPLRRNLYYGPQLEDEIGGGFIEGVNLDADAATTVHVIRQAGRSIWIQLSTHSHGAALVVVEARPFEATARWREEFPWLSMPAGYDQGNRPRTRDFDMYPFWTGNGFEEIEGRAHIASVMTKERAYSMYEVRRNLEAMMAEAGATRLFDGRIPKEASDRYGADLKGPYSDGTDFSWHDYDSLVYRVDLPEGRQVWVHARLEYLSAGWVVVEREGFVQTAALLPAAALKRQLDADGRVAIQVNFAVDRAEILPDSQPQIEQVLALLQQDPSLRLSVEGHTDDTGAADHNRSLSQARAASVVAALTAGDIDAARLSAAGFGADRPVADNGSEEGRARNRRVELVKRG
jgi:outer membrane protein OmpA-like peptidoglycan-associated protein